MHTKGFAWTSVEEHGTLRYSRSVVSAQGERDVLQQLMVAVRSVTQQRYVRMRGTSEIRRYRKRQRKREIACDVNIRPANNH